jgi:hypothetical protein
MKISKKWEKTAQIYDHIGRGLTPEQREELYYYETFGKVKFAERYGKSEPARLGVKQAMDLFVEEYIRPVKEGWFESAEMYRNLNIDQVLFEMLLPDEYKLDERVVRALRRSDPDKEYELLVMMYTEFQEAYLVAKNEILRRCGFNPQEKEQGELMELAVRKYDYEGLMQAEILRVKGCQA